MTFEELTQQSTKTFPWLEANLVSEQAEACKALIVTSAMQLDSADFGVRLLTKARDPEHTKAIRSIEEDKTTLEISCTNLATRCSVTAVDLCGAIAGRIAGITTSVLGGKELDINDLTNQRNHLPPEIKLWLAALIADPTWADLMSIRNEVTHRWWRRDHTLEIGGPDIVASKIDIKLGMEIIELVEALSRLVGYTKSRWFEFTQLLIESE